MLRDIVGEAGCEVPGEGAGLIVDAERRVVARVELDIRTADAAAQIRMDGHAQIEIGINIDVEQADHRRGVAVPADTLALSLDLVGVELAVGAVELEPDPRETIAQSTAEDERVLELDLAVDAARARIDRVREGIAEIPLQVESGVALRRGRRSPVHTSCRCEQRRDRGSCLHWLSLVDIVDRVKCLRPPASGRGLDIDRQRLAHQRNPLRSSAGPSTTN